MAKENEEKNDPASNKANAIGGFLAMLPTIAGTIPMLRPTKQRSQLEAMQRGEGAGAQVARETANQAARQVIGASAARPSSGRAGNLREGLRAAQDITQRGAREAGRIASTESMLGTRALMADELRRRQTGMQLGAGLGGATASALGMLLAAKDQGPEQTPQGLTRDPIGLREATAYQMPQLSSPGSVDLGSPALASQSPPNQGGPFLQTGTQGSPEAFGTRLTPPAGLEFTPQNMGPGRAGVVEPVPNVNLGQPMSGFDMNQPGFVLSSVLQNPDPAQMKQDYVRNVARKSEMPSIRTGSAGGSDAQALVRSELLNYESWLEDQVRKGAMKPEEATRLLSEMRMRLQAGM